MKLEQLENRWINSFPKPLVIAGPCSAESENQMMTTALEIKQSGALVSVFRAGIWKPRTKPNGFEGVGEIGLKWLKKVKDELGFVTCTEVANASHVQQAVDADVDILWIGARSVANPFTVQEVADALRNTDKVILVKNPVNPDLSLWIGALERLVGAGIDNLGVIHRGFSTYQKTRYRNVPNWQIALDFKNLFPNIPIIVDPSHICGNRTGIDAIAQEALNMGYHGMMIETHCTPDEAWSDAKQQITPERLNEILQNLKVRSESFSMFQDEIEKFRTLISEVDAQLISLLAERMAFSEKIGGLKKENNTAIFQPDRWKTVMEEVQTKASQTGLSPDFVIQLFKAIHEHSLSVQNEIMNEISVSKQNRSTDA